LTLAGSGPRRIPKCALDEYERYAPGAERCVAEKALDSVLDDLQVGTFLEGKVYDRQ
jgi:hypothetical protein